MVFEGYRRKFPSKPKLGPLMQCVQHPFVLIVLIQAIHVVFWALQHLYLHQTIQQMAVLH